MEGVYTIEETRKLLLGLIEDDSFVETWMNFINSSSKVKIE